MFCIQISSCIDNAIRYHGYINILLILHNPFTIKIYRVKKRTEQSIVEEVNAFCLDEFVYCLAKKE